MCNAQKSTSTIYDNITDCMNVSAKKALTKALKREHHRKSERKKVFRVQTSVVCLFFSVLFRSYSTIEMLASVRDAHTKKLTYVTIFLDR